jgi:hypothetical protein
MRRVSQRLPHRLIGPDSLDTAYSKHWMECGSSAETGKCSARNEHQDPMGHEAHIMVYVEFRRYSKSGLL